ncbi:MAG: SMI1/KNR4 family protein [Pedobacter sp.]|nr:MAG: SMI1/KNR4 family protein [Pedobacter sp.]
MPFPVELRYILQTESILQVEFPTLFKNKMQAENGGEIIAENEDWQLFPFFDKSDNKRISRTSNHIILETKEAKEWDNFPSNGIAVGSNGSGDLLVLLPSDNGAKLKDQIYLWKHETGEIYEVAKSIEELQNS